MASTVKLYFVRESEKARYYSKQAFKTGVVKKEDFVWVPTSIIEHTTKYPVKPGEEYPILSNFLIGLL